MTVYSANKLWKKIRFQRLRESNCNLNVKHPIEKYFFIIDLNSK